MAVLLVCGGACRSTSDKWTVTSGSPAIDTTNPRNGPYSMHFTTSSAQAIYQHVFETAKAQACVSFAVNWKTLPNVTTQLAIGDPTAGTNAQIRITSAGAVLYRWGSGTATTHPTTIAVNRWYVFTIALDQGSGTKHINVHIDSLDGLGAVAGGNRDLVEAASTFTGVRVGVVTTNATSELFITDHVWTDTFADAPIADRQVFYYGAASCGSHSFTSGDFQDDTSTNLGTSETSSWSKLAETMPAVGASLATYVKQVVVRSTGYLEYGFVPDQVGDTPLAMCAVVGVARAVAGTATHDMYVNDGGTIDSQTIRGFIGVPATTIRHSFKVISARPNGGGAWTIPAIQAVKVRWGYSDDITPALEAVGIEVAWTSSPPPRNAIVNHQNPAVL